MSIDIIQQKLLSYQSKTVIDQENALKEIAQEIALLALSRTGFFRVAAFQGGTCLRILFGLDRFSEDLDFVLVQHNQQFDWEQYIDNMQEEFSAYGYILEVKNKSNLDKTIKSAFLKADSAGGLLILKDNRTNRPRLQIKLEIVSNPPAGSIYELHYLDFPLPFSIQCQNLPSLFASKCHALLCREYVKGRDWYDFLWYVSREITINMTLLSSALNQTGPWKNEDVQVTREWLVDELSMKIKKINWAQAKKDVARFLKPRELSSLELWDKEYFLSRVEKLSRSLGGSRGQAAG